VRAFNREFKKNVKSVAPAALKALTATAGPATCASSAMPSNAPCCWPKATCSGPITSRCWRRPRRSRRGFTLPLEGVNLEMLERDPWCRRCSAPRGNQTQAAQLLGMNRDQIRYRLEKFGLDKLGRPMADEKPA
jgi:transcriptional regulator with GAF, ATPase, and Fis domain